LTRADQEQKKKEGQKADEHQPSEVEQEFLKPSYKASIAGDVEDGLFDGGWISSSTVHFAEMCPFTFH
jgi:hypothetical protein